MLTTASTTSAALDTMTLQIIPVRRCSEGVLFFHALNPAHAAEPVLALCYLGVHYCPKQIVAKHGSLSCSTEADKASTAYTLLPTIRMQAQLAVRQNVSRYTLGAIMHKLPNQADYGPDLGMYLKLLTCKKAPPVS